jgi:hypothetical protein
MIATYTKPTTVKFTTSHRKEKGSYHFSSYIVIDLSAPPARRACDTITLRLYSTAARTTCCVWASGEGRGSGSAGGYGYHRPSAAAQKALNAVGFRFDKDFGGAGDNAIEEALLACAVTLGVKKPAIVVAHP